MGFNVKYSVLLHRIGRKYINGPNLHEVAPIKNEFAKKRQNNIFIALYHYLFTDK
jgi:hypothetical protein